MNFYYLTLSLDLKKYCAILIIIIKFQTKIYTGNLWRLSPISRKLVSTTKSWFLWFILLYRRYHVKHTVYICVYQHDHGNNKCTYTYIFLNKICTRTLSVFDVGLLCSSRAMFVQQISLLIIIIKIFQSIIQLQCIHTAEILVYDFVLQV